MRACNLLVPSLVALAVLTARASAAADPPADPAEGKPARPPPVTPTEDRTLPWERTLDIGGDLAFVTRPATRDAAGRTSRVRYRAATGFGLHIRWPIVKWLQLEGYMIDCHMPGGDPGRRDRTARRDHRAACRDVPSSARAPHRASHGAR